MLGPAINGIVIIICSGIGLLISKLLGKIDLERFEDIMLKATALAVVYIGLSGAMKNESVLLLIFSLVTGSVLGELINIDKRMNQLGKWAERKLGFSEGQFAQGFVTASILYCTGSMAIVGAMESGLSNNYEMLFAKAILDGVISIVFAYQMGIGVAFSAIPVFVYEGGIALAASAVKGWLSAEIILEMSAVGSLLIAAIGFNFLAVGGKEIKVANLIPAIFMPWIFLGIKGLIIG